MKGTAAPRPRATTSRVLAAALRVFSDHGLGATTREIATAAGVNEVTVFRQFATKENLITEVVREMCRVQHEALDRVDLNDFDLRRDLGRIAEAYDRATTEHVGFIRALLAAPPDPRLSEQLSRDAVEPLRSKFLAYLEEARKRGLVRDTVDPAIAVDAFTGMIFTGALHRSRRRRRYSRDAYLQSCVSLFLNGISSI